MKPLAWIKETKEQWLEDLHLKFASRKAHIELALLGTLSGIIAAAAMVLFRLVIEIPQAVLLGFENPENYENLSPLLRLLLATLGGLTVGLLFQRLTPTERAVGVVHAIERLDRGEGHLPMKNAGVQFSSAAICIIAGHSVGREGPSVHIGAACGSWIGQRLRLPNNTIRILVGCGAAGAIAAAFNTPLAGVIFTMEVVMVEYTIASFTPIILASVSATTVSRWMFGPEPVFRVPEFFLGSLEDLLYIVLMGILIGIMSTLFVQLLVFFSQRITNRPVWIRMTLAGALTGVVGMFVPQIMGIGYDTVNQVLQGNLGLELMVAILIGKLLATALGLGLGLPGGIIGPTLVMGALAGGAAGAALTLLIPGHTASSTLYTMVGMGAMMGATLNAPLAALTALLELTAVPHVILPGMLAIVAAELTSHYIFGTAPVFVKLTSARGVNYQNDPISQFLRRIGVTHAMDRQVIRLPQHVERSQLNKALLARPTWVLVQDNHILLTTEELLNYLESKALDATHFDLAELPVRQTAVESISSQATLRGALRKMDQEKVNALCVVPPQGERILGIITRQHIESSYRLPLN